MEYGVSASSQNLHPHLLVRAATVPLENQKQGHTCTIAPLAWMVTSVVFPNGSSVEIVSAMLSPSEPEKAINN